MSFLSHTLEGSALPDMAALAITGDSVTVAVNGCSAWVNQAVHGDGHWEALEPSLELIAARRAAGTVQDFRLAVRVTVDNFHELPALARLAEQLGADALVLDLATAEIAEPAHPLHLAMRETLRHPRLRTPLIQGDTIDAATPLPSDSLDRHCTREQLAAAIAGAAPSAETRAALCAAGRIRFPDDLSLLQIEAQALYELGLPQPARFRLFDCVAAGGEAIAIA